MSPDGGGSERGDPGGGRVVGPGFHAQVHLAVQAIPPGAVASYGDIAEALGSRRIARHVGWALAALPAGSEVPWWRVVDGQGRIARPGSTAARRQAAKLRAEGVQVQNGRIVDFALVRVRPG